MVVQLSPHQKHTINHGSDTNSSDKLSPAPLRGRRRGSEKGRPLSAGDLSDSVVALFWAKVQKVDGGCWLWQGYRDRTGYGLAYAGKIPGKKGSINHYAHRISYALLKGDVPRKAVVMHSCDVPSCVNPDHLRLGTQAENMRDASEKGRMNSPRPTIQKISDDYVREIRRTTGQLPSRYWADFFGVCVSHINRIRRGEKRQLVAAMALLTTWSLQ